MNKAEQERQRVADVKILQKVNAANREAFVNRFPGQLEHAMRLVHERLMNCMHKTQGMDLANPATWPATPQEIESLAQALWSLEQVRVNWPLTQE